MNCPRCGSKTHVNGTIRVDVCIVRYRQCQNMDCNYAFKTTATPEVMLEDGAFPRAERNDGK